MKVLGIDPGLRITGYGCVEPTDRPETLRLVEAGVVRLATGAAMASRLRQLDDELGQLIDELKPQAIAVEKLYAHYRHPRTAILMGHARGVVLLAAARRELPVTDVPATAVKKAMTGHGHASKEQMQVAVQSLYRLDSPPSPPDVADAIAIASTVLWRGVR